MRGKHNQIRDLGRTHCSCIGRPAVRAVYAGDLRNPPPCEYRGEQKEKMRIRSAPTGEEWKIMKDHD